MSRLTRLPASQLLARALIALSPPAALACTAPAGLGMPWWVLVVVLVLATAWAFAPEHVVGLACELTVVAAWGFALREGITPWLITASVLLCLAHVAATVAGYGPPMTPIRAEVAHLWLTRAIGLIGGVPLLYGLLTAIPHTPGGIWVLGMSGVFASVVAVSFFLATDRRHPDS